MNAQASHRLFPRVLPHSTDVPSNDEYYWPPVLQYLDFMDWAKREGGEDIFPLIVYKHQGYRGPCRTVLIPRHAAPVEQLATEDLAFLVAAGRERRVERGVIADRQEAASVASGPRR